MSRVRLCSTEDWPFEATEPRLQCRRGAESNARSLMPKMTVINPNRCFDDSDDSVNWSLTFSVKTKNIRAQQGVDNDPAVRGRSAGEEMI